MADSARSVGRKVNIVQAIALLLTFALLAGTGGLLAAGFILPLAAGANTLTDETVQVFEDLPDELEPGPLSQKSTIYDKDGNVLANFYLENRTVVPLDEISMDMQNAVIAIEDKRFFAHGGVDIAGIGRALAVNVLTNREEGASTLTQQYVKNVLIEQAKREDDQQAIAAASESTPERKLREAKLAIAVEKKMSKLEILERYLNIAQFGASVYGVESAANYYFNKSAADLTIVEAATIAGITQAPNKYDAAAYPEANLGRRNIVLDRMYAEGFITKEEHAEARATPVEDTLNVTPVENNCEAAGDAGFFCSYVTQVILSDPVFGETREDRRQLLLRGGLEIHTTLDSALQQVANEKLRETVPADDPTGIADALVSVTPGTGEILVMAQNRKYVANSDDAGVGETSVNYSTDQAHGGSRGFQAGSTFKPFVLAEWLKSGHNLSERVNASRQTWTSSDFSTSCEPGLLNGMVPWNPANADGQASGQITVLTAAANSVNTAFVNILSQLDLCDVADTAYEIGYRPARTSDEGTVTITPSMVLGTQDTSPLAMANAFATFASGGTYCDPVAITSITDADGNELEIPGANCRTVLDERVVSGVNYALQEVLNTGSGRVAQLVDGRTAAGKTGSTNENVHTWFVGYTPQMATAAWVGHPDRKVPMVGITINGVTYNRVYGSTLAAPLWKSYMDVALADLPNQAFGEVDEVALEGEKKDVPRVWGRSVSDAESILSDAGFSTTVRSEQVYSQAPAGTVAYTYPSGEVPAGTSLTIYVSNGQTEPPAEDDQDDDSGDSGDQGDRGGDRGRTDDDGDDG